MSSVNLEEFKEIPNCSRYLISENGEVWDTEACKFVAQMNNNGYMVVNINYGSRRSVEKVHRLVYRTYVAEVTSGIRLRHKDNDRTNNHYTNIIEQGKTQPHSEPKQNYLELSLYSVNKFKSIRETARSIWHGIIARCYDPSNLNYKHYGGKGVSVCEEWKTQETFIEWYNDNNIIGWAIDKDMLANNNLSYSPATCVFIPRGLNSLVVNRKSPKIVKTSSGYCLATSIVCKYVAFYGDTKEDCLEQLSLVRALQLEKMLWLMEDYVSKIPNSPKIDPRVIKKIKDMIG